VHILHPGRGGKLGAGIANLRAAQCVLVTSDNFGEERWRELGSCARQNPARLVQTGKIQAVQVASTQHVMALIQPQNNVPCSQFSSFFRQKKQSIMER